MKFERRKAKYSLIAIGAVLLALLAQPALAIPIDKYWVGPNPNTNWTTANNWSTTMGGPGGAGQPLAGANAFLISTTSKTATLNTVTPSLLGVYVDTTGGGTFNLNESGGGYALNSLNEYIGVSGIGVYNQSAGSNTATGNLALGYNPGSLGTYNKSGGSLTIGTLTAGLYGTGVFNQSSGGVTVNNDLYLGYFPGSNGTYKMSAGTLGVGGNEFIGFFGTGTFTQSSGNQTIGGYLDVGFLNTGTFTMSSGTLKVTGSEYIGDGATGTFTQSSGSHIIGGSLHVGWNPGSSGTFKMTSGSVLVNGDEFIGEGGTGVFTQTSGSNTVKGNFVVGDGTPSTGTYSMTSGSLSVQGANGEIIGHFGNGTFNQTSGSNTAQTITLAAGGPGPNTGTYNLNSGSVTATSSAANAIWIKGSTSPDGHGTGTFNITGSGTVNGNVTNDGNVNNYGTVTWNGTFTNNNVYTAGTSATSSKTTQTFKQDLVVNPTGYIVANSPLKPGPTVLSPKVPQDLFIFASNFQNQSTQNMSWNTEMAEMQFIGASGTNHTLYIPGIDNGTAAIPNNFNWYELDITNQNLYLKDGNTTAGGAQYVKVFVDNLSNIDKVDLVVKNLYGDPTSPLNMYYDTALNPGLGGLDYTFANGFGSLKADDWFDEPAKAQTLSLNSTAIPDSAVPLPPSMLLLGSGLLGLGAMGWRRKRLMG